MSASKKARVVTASSATGQRSTESGWTLEDVLNTDTGDAGSGTAGRHPGDVAKALFGDTANVTQTLSYDLDMKEGPNHSTTGIPYAIHGTATIVQQRVAAALAKYQDPIKAVLPTSVHNSKRIVIRRKYVVGGEAIITPERAPARTVAIREDERQIVLTRYGGDLEMNLNLFLRPADAREEFEMKLEAQMRQLEHQMVILGYEALMEQGTNLLPALARMMPKQEGPDSERLARAAANSVYVSSVFGCIQKNRYPLQNMMAAAKMAGLFMPAVNGGYDTCILPTGLLEMERVTKRENMEYYLTGTDESKRKQVKVELENVYADPRVPNMRLMIHQPFPSFANGAAHPSMDNNSSCLSRTINLGIVYQYTNSTPAGVGGANQRIRFPDYANNCWKVVDVPANTSHVEIQPNLKLQVASAIMAVSGAATGELLYAYPSTGISTSQTTEALKMQLRVYMGSVLYDPTRVLVIPDVHIEGIVGAAALIAGRNPLERDSVDLAEAFRAMRAERPGAVNFNNANALAAGEATGIAYPGDDSALALVQAFEAARVGAAGLNANPNLANFLAGNAVGADAAAQAVSRAASLNAAFDDAEEPLVFYQGRVEVMTTDRGWVECCPNTGHLGTLDRPDEPGLRGQFRFSDHP